MTWHQQFRDKMAHHNDRAEPTQVDTICGIPFQATQAERFRLTAEVEEVVEQETKTGKPCYFLNCRDEEGMAFTVVVWESQWSRQKERLKEGARVTLDLRVPKEGFSSFTLA